MQKRQPADRIHPGRGPEAQHGEAKGSERTLFEHRKSQLARPVHRIWRTVDDQDLSGQKLGAVASVRLGGGFAEAPRLSGGLATDAIASGAATGIARTAGAGSAAAAAVAAVGAAAIATAGAVAAATGTVAAAWSTAAAPAPGSAAVVAARSAADAAIAPAA